MDEILYASSLEILHASRGTGHHKHGAAIQVLEGRDGVLSILIVA